jgi:hypothetical protein
VLSYVGVATSIGQVVEVPLIVRSLAESIATLQEDQLPVGFDYDFMLSLDADLSVQDSRCRLVENYHNDWWNRRKPRMLEMASVLDSRTMDRCLEKHVVEVFGRPIEDDSWSLGPDMPRLGRTFSTKQNTANSSTPDSSCRKCEQYRDILSNTLQDILDIRSFSNTIMTSTETEWSLAMRRASTFNLLHEAVVMKERDDESSAAQDPRLKSLPSSSLKWTWGETLTKEDVLDLGRSGTRPINRIHSGYDISLNDDRPADEDSAPSMPASVEDQENAMPRVSLDIPDYNHPPIDYFENRQYLKYDPLGKGDFRRAASPAHSAGVRQMPKGRRLVDLTSENVYRHTEYVDKESSAGEEGSGNLERGKSSEGPGVDIANVWESDVDEIVDEPTEGIEDMWSSASEENAKSTSAPALHGAAEEIEGV